MTKPETSCPMDGLLRLISGPWTTFILWQMSQVEKIRFGELKRAVPGISSRVLTERLRKLEGAGLVHREYVPTVPPQVSYSLTKEGWMLRGVLEQMNDVAHKLGLNVPCHMSNSKDAA
ncbi:winged helix-turn-helix transcriptional regulator [Actibacterium mucosum]|nr:helix-turn-helix domain-containing protein [Actibacterium mucosum]